MSTRVARPFPRTTDGAKLCRGFGAWVQEFAAAKRFVACRSGGKDLQEKDPTARVRARLWGRKEGKRLSFLMSSFCPFEAFNTIPLGLQGSSRQGHQPPVPCSVWGMNCIQPDKKRRRGAFSPSYLCRIGTQIYELMLPLRLTVSDSLKIA
jgi:hypothetical protein